MPTSNLDLLQGTLDLLVLKAVAWGPRHGYAVAQWLRDTTDQTLNIEQSEVLHADPSRAPTASG